MRFKTVGNKLDAVALVVKNAHGSSIPRGSPVALTLSGTNDGLAVVLPSSSAAKAHAFAFGVALAAIADGAFGECQAYGFNSYAIILRGTRAASTDSWTSTASSPLGCLLNIDTVNNAFSTSGGTLAVTAFLPFAVLAESIASVAASASATSDTRTALTQTTKTFLRML